MYTPCFDQYSHHQALKYLVGKLIQFYCAANAYMVPQMRTCVVLGVSCSHFFFIVCFILEFNNFYNFIILKLTIVCT
jgi:hypothetical protein